MRAGQIGCKIKFDKAGKTFIELIESIGTQELSAETY